MEEEYGEVLQCKLVVSRFVSVSKLRALCEYRVDDNTDEWLLAGWLALLVASSQP